MANNCKQCFNAHYQTHCHPLPTAYDCVAVYIAGRCTNLVVYGCDNQKHCEMDLFIFRIKTICKKHGAIWMNIFLSWFHHWKYNLKVDHTGEFYFLLQVISVGYFSWLYMNIRVSLT